MSDTPCPVASFSEEAYLRCNPDVSRAVTEGVFRSGWDHFLLYGHAEDRAGAPEILEPDIEKVLKDPRGTPLPPGDLRVRVHNADDPSGFVRLGKTVAFDLYAVLNERVVDPGVAHEILDFGCGCGRVLPWVAYLYPRSRITGCDIDREAIDWCTRHLNAIADFRVNDTEPPLDFGDARFDLVYSISIFTHLPEAMQLRWLEELNRVTRPGGLLILTVRGARFLPNPSRRARRQIERKGFYYLKGRGTRGLPAFYQTSYHSREYINREWGRYFDILEIRDEAVAGRQDLVLCRRRQNFPGGND